MYMYTKLEYESIVSLAIKHWVITNNYLVLQYAFCCSWDRFTCLGNDTSKAWIFYETPTAECIFSIWQLHKYVCLFWKMKYWPALLASARVIALSQMDCPLWDIACLSNCWPSAHLICILTNNMPLLAACMLHIHKICIGWGPTGMAILEHLIKVFPDGRMQFQHILEKLSCHCMCYAQAFQKSTYMLCVITMSYPSNSQNPMTSTSHIYVVQHQFNCAVLLHNAKIYRGV